MLFIFCFPNRHLDLINTMYIMHFFILKKNNNNKTALFYDIKLKKPTKAFAYTEFFSCENYFAFTNYNFILLKGYFPGGRRKESAFRKEGGVVDAYFCFRPGT